ncbi:hypothetical protein THTE_0313 [Thermogutta terrifontis]|uniref:Uncharacterized protein n=1 Tax=Thermogutta terrifontis TaxID=1331910 RepID=A0A286RAC0_9BACT|nr:hypothetical protein THTE_0313 [Thermogutta terrifontis]
MLETVGHKAGTAQDVLVVLTLPREKIKRPAFAVPSFVT